MGVGLRLKIALREKNMTIKELSTRSGVSLNTLYSITKRDTENVDTVILSMITDTLGLSWSFFCSSSPFEDLDFLRRNKESILLELEKSGAFARNGRPLTDIGDYEFWKILSDNVFDITESEAGNIQVLCPQTLTYNPNSYIGADIDTLVSFFSKLEPWGRKLVIEYAELLTNNPGFLLKKHNSKAE